MPKELGYKFDSELVVPTVKPVGLSVEPDLDALLESYTKKLVIGVDPGGNGAIATIEIATGKTDVIDMPTMKQHINGSSRLRVDVVALTNWLRARAPYCALACVEKAGCRPSNGAVQALNTGASWGLVVGVLAGLGIPVLDADPAKWKPAMKVTADKDTSRARACLLWPDMAPQVRLKKHDGRAEALLIALYGVLRAQRVKAGEGLLPKT